MPGLGAAAVAALSSAAAAVAAPAIEQQSWTRGLRAHTPRVEFLALPSAVAASLLAGTLTLPTVAVPQPEDDTWYDGTPVADASADSDSSDSESGSAPCPPELAACVHAIDVSVRRLGGAVSPKLGGVSPSDATWVSFHRSTRCESASDVLTLIAASERVMAAQHAADGTPVLALRTWLDGIDSMMEYRVFVRRGVVVGLSQRDIRVSSTLSQSEMDKVVDIVQAQFRDVARAAFCPHHAAREHTSYTYDVFVDRAWRAWIIDAAPWGGLGHGESAREDERMTDALLFEWDELDAACWIDTAGDVAARAQFRVISSASSIRPAQAMYDGLPIELRNTDSTEALAEAAQRILKAQEEQAAVGQQYTEDCSSED
jgi:hypothetical protein